MKKKRKRGVQDVFSVEEVTLMHAANELIREIASCLDMDNPEDCLRRMCKKLLNALGARLCVIYLFDEVDEQLYVNICVGVDEKETQSLLRAEHADDRIELGKGVAGWVALHQKPLLIEDTASDSRCQMNKIPWRKDSTHYALIALPLISFDNFIGVLEILRNKGRSFSESEIDLLYPIVRIMATAIPRGSEASITKLAEICVRFLEEKDHYTHGHSIRVMRYCMVLADELKLPKKQKDELRLCALLHDIGKVILKDSILSKPGKLTKFEWDLIRLHPSIGSNILGKISKNLAHKIVSHHERFDGTGYPSGISGTAIPLISRIIAIADALDAITTKRPYRPAATLEFAIEEIEANSNTQFDPKIVDALVSAHENGRLVLEKV